MLNINPINFTETLININAMMIPIAQEVSVPRSRLLLDFVGFGSIYVM